jgi:hypothetical protein
LQKAEHFHEWIFLGDPNARVDCHRAGRQELVFSQYYPALQAQKAD